MLLNISTLTKGQIVMARPLDQKHLQNCSSCGVFPVCSGQYLSKVAQKEGTVMNRRQGHGGGRVKAH
ncbi:hypothetical protein QTP86_028240 [Hemibagrus guttatus]|nr:hypothetical protein QTP86_028240 [Hemibagrus guttatus]